MAKQLLFFLLCSITFGVFAQDSVNVDLSTPQSALITHLLYLQEDNYNEHLAALPFNLKNRTEKEAITAAIKLKQILDGEGIYIDVHDTPKDEDYVDSLSKKNRYVLTSEHPEIYLVKEGENWYYSERSIVFIDILHKKVFRFGTDRLVRLLPKLGTRKVLGLHMYQYIGILILAFLSTVIHKVFTFIVEKIFIQLIHQAGYERLAGRYLLPAARPASMFLVFGLLVIFAPVLQLPPDISHYVMIVLKALIPLFGTMVFYRMVDVLALYLERLAQKTKSTLDDQLVPLMRKTLKTFIVIIGTLFVLSNLNIDIIPLLTGLSIGGLAFALAAQDTIKNFFGSLMIFIDKPFQIGDWITSGDIDGTVEEVGFRSSRIRTFRNSLMYVPNGKMADSVIDNHGLRQYRRFYTQITVTYDTPPELIETFVEGLRKIVETHPNTRKDYYNIYFNDMASFSLNIMFYIFFEVPDWPGELKARHEVLLEIVRLAEKLGVNFAFPTQTLHMENFPGQPSMSPSYVGKDEMKLKLDEYFNSKQ
ncbi:mechanosensitive ion channel family protein [Marinoscillum sp. MHG1-6]|uniref:mechanosensitive ion channel family protein n=1 Tax=Marinoscillum sp. MHG1-6 TaxID=2959627 RepID=UPI0021570833|nr:mechanosensitive ion channel family protein [Marinoscillum sp. MHG1-6]